MIEQHDNKSPLYLVQALLIYIVPFVDYYNYAISKIWLHDTLLWF